MTINRLAKPLEVKKGGNTVIPLRLSQGNVVQDVSQFVFRTDLRYKITDIDAIATLTSDVNEQTLVDNGFDNITNALQGIVLMKLSKTILDSVTIPKTTKLEFPFVLIYFDIEYAPVADPTNFAPFLTGSIRVYEDGTKTNG